MASNVFGAPITQGSRSERAAIAASNDNLGSKRDKAVEYVNNEKGKFGKDISTLCIFYNATGATLKKRTDQNYDGKVSDTYPLEVQNGQWGAFLHGNKASAAKASKAYVTYRVESNNNGQFCTTLIGWETDKDKKPNEGNHAFCGVYDDGAQIDNVEMAKNIEDGDKQATATDKGISMVANIDSTSSPLFEAHFSLQNDA